jgi:vacuolar-type H+-ATPase subunit E/Vma4
MSLGKVESVIIDEVRSEAEKTVAQAKQESESSLARFREAASRELDEAVQREEAAAARETARQLGIARQEGKMAVLEAKNRVIETVFARVADKLNSLDSTEYLALIEGWLKNLPTDIGGAIVLNPRDEKLVTGSFLTTINKNRSESGTLTGISFDPGIGRGFVIKGHNFSADFTFDTLIGKVRETSVGDLSKELFVS